ncbi:MAG TPA: LuxR C-terminal-related transcriptional regulator [Thermoanaerobaculia bacterium]|nr:LuxR C-terminal-related transcriptional regulator [Thermoanaerobaculia bacterium]HUM28796.1 LuxR C-terminal-related transcriptional regulator [Thermoanaerobaculia bacterium]HXK69053.1 LuxR C-terminal-related transcriptional regulator [Thermoanaerobaculia bacterium]
MPYSYLSFISGETLYDNIRSEVQDLTRSLFASLSLRRIDLYIRVHVLQLNILFSRVPGKDCTVQKLEDNPNWTIPEPECRITGDVENLIDYDLLLTPEKNVPSRRERTLLKHLVYKSLQSLFLREQLLFALVLEENQKIALIVFGPGGQILAVNRRGDRILGEQTEDLLALPLGNRNFIPFITYLSTLDDQVRNENLYLTSGQQYVIDVLSIDDALLGPVRMVILREMLPFDHEALSEHLDKMGFTRREQEISFYLLRGLTNEQIADIIGISALTVKDHLSHAYKKLAVKSKHQFICNLLGMKQPVHQNGSISDTIGNGYA